MNYDGVEIDDELIEDLSHTKIGDDIDILVNLVFQQGDASSGEDVVCQVPRNDRHRKYWTDYEASELALALERKYKNAPRLAIPKEFDTSF